MKNLLAFAFFFATITVFAQYDPNYKRSQITVQDNEPSKVNLGLGLGLDYGGVGARVSVFPIKYVGAFGAVGYNLHKLGYNFGATFRIRPDKKICPIATAMYGYNAVIIVLDAPQYDKTYYGPSFGGGIEIRFKNNQNYLNLELLAPIRSPEFYDYIDLLRNNFGVNDIEEPSPLTFSIGYHIKF